MVNVNRGTDCGINNKKPVKKINDFSDDLVSLLKIVYEENSELKQFIFVLRVL